MILTGLIIIQKKGNLTIANYSSNKKKNSDKKNKDNMKNGNLMWRNEKVIWRIERWCKETKNISCETKKKCHGKWREMKMLWKQKKYHREWWEMHVEQWGTKICYGGWWGTNML